MASAAAVATRYGVAIFCRRAATKPSTTSGIRTYHQIRSDVVDEGWQPVRHSSGPPSVRSWAPSDQCRPPVFSALAAWNRATGPPKLWYDSMTQSATPAAAPATAATAMPIRRLTPTPRTTSAAPTRAAVRNTASDGRTRAVHARATAR
jgi:hypothetical protein